MPIGSVSPVSGETSDSAGTDPDESGDGASSSEWLGNGASAHGASDLPDLDPIPLRGWISPDDRLWRHPSEIGASAARASTIRASAVRSRRRPGRSGSLWIAVGAVICLAGTLGVSGLALMDTGPLAATSASSARSQAMSLESPPTTEEGTARLVGISSMEHGLTKLQSSLVALTVSRPSGTSQATGVIVASGGMVVTVASALAGASSVEAVEPNGTRETAQIVGSDPTSGIAVVKVSSDLPAASFARGDMTPGSMAMAVALTAPSKRHHAPWPAIYAGTISSSGTAVGADPATTLFAATAVDTPLAASDRGAPLVDGSGQVAGILETTKVQGATTVAVFLPAELVYGVAYQLVTTGSVVQGWLGIDASNPVAATTTPTPSGVVVDRVETGSSAAAGGLQAGDQIVGVDGGPVHSVAELRARLYPIPPGTEVSLTCRRAGSVFTTQVVLGSSGPGTPEAAASP